MLLDGSWVGTAMFVLASGAAAAGADGSGLPGCVIVVASGEA